MAERTKEQVSPIISPSFKAFLQTSAYGNMEKMEKVHNELALHKATDGVISLANMFICEFMYNVHNSMCIYVLVSSIKLENVSFLDENQIIAST